MSDFFGVDFDMSSLPMTGTRVHLQLKYNRKTDLPKSVDDLEIIKTNKGAGCSLGFEILEGEFAGFRLSKFVVFTQDSARLLELVALLDSSVSNNPAAAGRGDSITDADSTVDAASASDHNFTAQHVSEAGVYQSALNRGPDVLLYQTDFIERLANTVIDAVVGPEERMIDGSNCFTGYGTVEHFGQTPVLLPGTQMRLY